VGRLIDDEDGGSVGVDRRVEAVVVRAVAHGVPSSVCGVPTSLPTRSRYDRGGTAVARLVHA
jgi:hypothetical protein